MSEGNPYLRRQIEQEAKRLGLSDEQRRALADRLRLGTYTQEDRELLIDLLELEEFRTPPGKIRGVAR
jgi:hypothetical protein